MTADRANLGQRVITINRAEKPYPTGYFAGLVGCGLRMPAYLEGGRSFAGFLVAVEETETEIVLTFEGLQPE